MAGFEQIVGVVAAATLVAAPMWGCGRNCPLTYFGASVQLPDAGATEDCIVTFTGSTNTGTYDCPASSPGCSCPPSESWNACGWNCTAEGSAPQFEVAYRYGSDCLPPGGVIDVGSRQPAQFQSWLGGPGFSWTLTCGGVLIEQAQGQAAVNTCPE